MRLGTLCSGIGAPEQAAQRLGWATVYASEVDPFARAVLEARHPSARQLGDLYHARGDDAPAVDVICAGTPCQGFSCAGARGGLDDHRSDLVWEFCRFIGAARPQWFVWENVDHVLYIDGGRAFSAIIGEMARRGYSLAWRVLDSQYFGLAQRRRRVFVVGCFGDRWQPSAAVLFDPQSLQGAAAPSGLDGAPFEPGTTVGAGSGGRLIAGALDTGYTQNGHGGRRATLQNAAANHVVPFSLKDRLLDVGPVSPPLRALSHLHSHSNGGQSVAVAPILEVGKRCGKITPRTGVGIGRDGDPMYTLTASAKHGVAFSVRGRGDSTALEVDRDGLVNLRGSSGGSSRSFVAVGESDHLWPRALTPMECERLMGFPDGYTAIEYQGKPASDTRRYKAVGNSMAVPVLEWILKRIEAVTTLEGATP